MKLALFTHNGLNVIVRDGPCIFAEQEVVREVQREYPWDFAFETAIDIGAHIGAWTSYAKRMQPSARIVAVELDPDNYDLLALNTKGLPGIRLVHGRAGYDAGDYLIGRSLRNSGSTAAWPIEEAHHIADPYLVWLDAPAHVTLEDLMARGEFAHVDVLKLDCEGAEVDLLQHAQDDTLMRIGRVIGEIHTTPDVFEDQTQRRLQQAGFQVEYRPHAGDPNLFYIHAWRNG